MSSTKGPPFTSPPIPPILRKWAAELNSAHPATWLPSGPSLGLVHRFFEETSRGSLRRGSELTYNHDAHNPIGAFTFGPEEAASLAPLGLTYGPGRCRHPAECPPSAFYPSTIITMPLAPSYNRSPPHAGLNNIPSQSRPFAMAVRHNT